MGEVEKRRTRVDKLPMRPRESIWTPCSPERSQGDSTLHPHYKKAIAVTVGYNMALLLCHTTCHLPSLSTVIMEETYRGVVLDRPPETF